MGRGWCFKILVVLVAVFAQPAHGQTQEVDFNRDIRPLLSDKCFHCHGPDNSTREADLRFDKEASAKAQHDGTAAIVPGKPQQSELVARIRSRDPDEMMPPPESGKSLKPAEIERLAQWVAQGAKWSQHWAYEIPRPRSLPAIRKQNWPRNWIDQFVLARIESAGLQPSQDADRITLARRLHFDLTGLPPSAEFVNDFVRDSSDKNFARAIDRLLNSKHFGEKLAMYWLDLVRYADTVGYHGDQDHNISPYRDWVIDAFNSNMPFDEFTRAQLAGDLVPDATLAHKVASGYNRLLQTTHEGGLQPREYRAIYAADRVRNVSNVWMGATVGCAQCHDHKYDPYTAKDFYSLSAFFADVDDEQHFKSGTNSLPTRRAPEVLVFSDPADQAEYDRLQAESARLSKDKSQAKRRKKIDQQLKAHRAKGRLSMITAALASPRETKVLPRGNWLDESGPVVQAAVPEFLPVVKFSGKRATRLDLANWLTDSSSNGVGLLTARVFVNRFWYLMFGEGLSRSLDDFGGQGEPPSHPELLDQLAIEFVNSGWDIKHMFRLMALSRAYRQSSVTSDELLARDPLNRLFARQARYRLPAESIRDTALSVSGLLVDEFGGRVVKPYQPAGYYRHLNFPQRKYKHDADARQWRRGVYVHWQRQFLHPMLRALDAPTREECTAKRPRSNTPIAALVMLNDPSFVEAARVFAGRIVSHAADDTARLTFTFQTAVTRDPDEAETELLLGLLKAERMRFQSDTAAAKKLLATGQAAQPASDQVVDVAAWTSVARAVLNMSETLSRN